MFKCQLCGTQVPRGVPPQLVITQKRPRVYSHHWLVAPNCQRARDTRLWRELPRSKNGGRKNGKPRFIEIYVPNHSGWEIAREMRACGACAAKKDPTSDGRMIPGQAESRSRNSAALRVARLWTPPPGHRV